MNQLFVLTTYFNPCRYQTRRKNYDLFLQGIRAVGVPCITIECAFGEQPFELPRSLEVIQIRAQDLLWQKERLLNLAATWLPKSCRFIAWIDCDILFDNSNWHRDLVKVLKTHQVAQLFETCIRLNSNMEIGTEVDRAESFASIMSKDPQKLNCGRYDLHGHTGYGWAMRREIFDEFGLYDCAISGSADHFMAHAIYGDYNFCISNALKNDRKQIDHLKQWGDPFYQKVQGSLGVVPGNIRHLWHGEAIHRRYFLRMHEITDLGFNPWTDIQRVPGQALQWSSAIESKPELKHYFQRYFESRLEDGVQV